MKEIIIDAKEKTLSLMVEHSIANQELSASIEERSDYLLDAYRNGTLEPFFIALSGGRGIFFHLELKRDRRTNDSDGDLFLTYSAAESWIDTPESLSVSLDWEIPHEQDLAMSIFSSWMLERETIDVITRLFPYFSIPE